ncbi:MAG: class I SAM-dependent methyltransferase [Planctomycetota bacterium]
MSDPLELEAVRRIFDDWARDSRGPGMEEGHRDIVLQLLDRAGLEHFHHVLDAGCGSGWTVLLIAELVPGGRAFGVDASPEMIRAALSAPHPPNATFTAAPVDALPLQEASIHRAVSMESIYYWPDVLAGLAEIFRVLRPGGRFLSALEFYADNPWSAGWAQALGLPLQRLSAARYQELFRQAGFEEVRASRLVDRRPLKNPRAFQPGSFFPSYDAYRRHREEGALLVEGRKPGEETPPPPQASFSA